MDDRESMDAYLPELERDLDNGMPWDAAVARLLDRLPAHGYHRPAWPPPEGRLNWIWLTEMEGVGAAIDLASPFGDLARELSRETDRTGGRVLYLACPSTHSRIVRKRFQQTSEPVDVVEAGTAAARLPAAGSADCLVFSGSPGWEARVPAELARTGRIGPFARDVLRPGGWLVCLLENPLVNVRRRRGWRSAREAAIALSQLTGLMRGIRQAGFEEVRSYIGGPSLDAPAMMIPYRPQTISAWLAVSRPSTAPVRYLRSRAAGLLFPIRILLARA
jgi:hypothetical protein